MNFLPNKYVCSIVFGSTLFVHGICPSSRGICLTRLIVSVCMYGIAMTKDWKFFTKHQRREYRPTCSYLNSYVFIPKSSSCTSGITFTCSLTNARIFLIRPHETSEEHQADRDPPSPSGENAPTLARLSSHPLERIGRGRDSCCVNVRGGRRACLLAWANARTHSVHVDGPNASIRDIFKLDILTHKS